MGHGPHRHNHWLGCTAKVLREGLSLVSEQIITKTQFDLAVGDPETGKGVHPFLGCTISIGIELGPNIMLSLWPVELVLWELFGRADSVDVTIARVALSDGLHWEVRGNPAVEVSCWFREGRLNGGGYHKVICLICSVGAGAGGLTCAPGDTPDGVKPGSSSQSLRITLPVAAEDEWRSSADEHFSDSAQHLPVGGRVRFFTCDQIN